MKIVPVVLVEAVGRRTFYLTAGTKFWPVVHEMTGRTVPELFARADTLCDAEAIVAIVWLTLQEFHAAEFPTIEDATKWYDRHSHSPALREAYERLDRPAMPHDVTFDDAFGTKKGH